MKEATICIRNLSNSTVLLTDAAADEKYGLNVLEEKESGLLPLYFYS